MKICYVTRSSSPTDPQFFPLCKGDTHCKYRGKIDVPDPRHGRPVSKIWWTPSKVNYDQSLFFVQETGVRFVQWIHNDKTSNSTPTKRICGLTLLHTFTVFIRTFWLRCKVAKVVHNTDVCTYDFFWILGSSYVFSNLKFKCNQLLVLRRVQGV